MGRTFRDAMAADARRVFLNPRELSVPVEYEASGKRVELVAFPEEVSVEVSDELGTTAYQMWTWLVAPEALDFGSGPVTPEKGAIVHEGGRQFSVTAPQGRKHWEWDDEYRSLIRIYTTLTKGKA